MSSESDIAIAARGVSKSYSIAHNAEKLPLGKALKRRLRQPLRRASLDTFWALQDVSFDIRRSEVVGIVGRNGAGKSTLLKLLCHISEPTRGQIGIWGRIGSLLEVGTGFHPELTGRENMFLNGAILGMTRAEIRQQFDAIVDFSGVEQFLDTPVKRYSSGMCVRLAFSVAVHLKPEILIVDEVLAVGDGDFQRRCLAKMDEVARSGRTIILVSHNLGSIQALCSRVLFLEGGRLVQDGPADEVIGNYLQRLQTMSGSTEDDPDSWHGSGVVRVTHVRLLSPANELLSNVMGGEDLVVEIAYQSPTRGQRASVILNLYNDDGLAVAAAHTLLTRPDLPPLGEAGVLRCVMRRLPLTTGQYRLAIAIQVNGETADYLPRAASLEVIASIFYETGVALDSKKAVFLLDHAWDHADAPADVVAARREPIVG